MMQHGPITVGDGRSQSQLLQHPYRGYAFNPFRPAFNDGRNLVSGILIEEIVWDTPLLTRSQLLGAGTANTSVQRLDHESATNTY